MFQREKPYRVIDLETNRPCLAARTRNSDRYVSGREWREIYPQYVDINGQLTTLQGEALDAAIRKKTLITGDQWRELNIDRQVQYSPNAKVRDFYIDVLTGLTPVNPDNNQLLVINEQMAREKIICGEWVTIKHFISNQGTTEFVDQEGKITELTGSALFAALKNESVRGRNRSTKIKKRKEDVFDRVQSAPSLSVAESPPIAKPVILTPVILHRQPQRQDKRRTIHRESGEVATNANVRPPAEVKKETSFLEPPVRLPQVAPAAMRNMPFLKPAAQYVTPPFPGAPQSVSFFTPVPVYGPVYSVPPAPQVPQSPHVPAAAQNRNPGTQPPVAPPKALVEGAYEVDDLLQAVNWDDPELKALLDFSNSFPLHSLEKEQDERYPAGRVQLPEKPDASKMPAAAQASAPAPSQITQSAAQAQEKSFWDDLDDLIDLDNLLGKSPGF